MNTTLLTGRLTKDPDLRYTQSGTAVTNFTVAVNRRFKKDGEPTADFIFCVAWGKTAELIAQYMQKGSKLGVIGRIQTSNYEDKDGKKVYKTEIIAEQVEFLESKKKDETIALAEEVFKGAEMQDQQIPF